MDFPQLERGGSCGRRVAICKVHGLIEMAFTPWQPAAPVISSADGTPMQPSPGAAELGTENPITRASSRWRVMRAHPYVC